MRNWMPRQPLLFAYWLPRYPVFQFASLFQTQSVMPPLVTYPSLCSTCMTYRTPYHFIGHQVLLIQPLPREADNFPRGDKHCKHVPPLTYLIYLSPLGVCILGSIYMSKSPLRTLINFPLVLNQHFKSPICW